MWKNILNNFLRKKHAIMKTLIILIFMAFIATNEAFAGKVPGVDLNGKNNSFILADDKQNAGDTIIVPETVRTSFIKMYPNATSIVWYRYTPVMPRVETDWYYSLDTNDYYVSFWDGADYVAWFDNGAWVHSTMQIDDSELPAAIRQSITSQFPGYVITDVDLEKDKAQSVYEVELEKGADRWKVHYSPSGSIIKKKSTAFTKADVEDAMSDDFEKRYPNATVVTWYKYMPRERVDLLPSDWEYGLDENDYQVRFSMDGADYIAYYDNGAWVRSETTVFDPKKLPATVNDAIKKQYAGYMIKDVEREESKNQILYEVELVKGNEKCKIHYTADGSISKKKCRTS